MPFRPDFDCLWCGKAWKVRSADDLEGWASLCPECLGKADDNGFLRMRLRTALRERSAEAMVADPTPGTVPATPAASSTAPAGPVDTPGDWEDWYLRRGRFSRGPVYDGPWSMELDEATRWLDGVAPSGVLVELGAGMGWWTGLLAEKGELWLYDADGASLDAARQRLMAHGLLAHLHQRDVLAAPDKAVDAVFAAYLLSAAGSAADLDARLAVAAAWLKPGGAFAFVEARPNPDGEPIDGPDGRLWPRDPETLRRHLLRAGFTSVEIAQTSSAFVLGRAVAAT